MQSKRHSFIEANLNTLVGFILSYFTFLGINWFYDLSLSYIQSFKIVIVFTLISIIRNYFIRK